MSTPEDHVNWDIDVRSSFVTRPVNNNMTDGVIVTRPSNYSNNYSFQSKQGQMSSMVAPDRMFASGFEDSIDSQQMRTKSHFTPHNGTRKSHMESTNPIEFSYTPKKQARPGVQSGMSVMGA